MSGTNRARAHEQLARRIGLHDQLTGLPNRTLFRDRLEQATEHAAREGIGLALLLVDVDRFKNVNDAVGTLAGDELLRGVARRLLGAARSTDTIARFGGDEFAVLSDGVDGEPGAVAIAEALLGALDEPLEVGGRPVAARVSIGVALAAPDGAAPDNLIRDASVALFRAKEGGGGRFQVFDPGMRDRLLHRVNVEDELRRALDRDELTVVFQPLVNLATRRIASLEALLRWEHPESGVVLPAEFQDVAETSALAVPLGWHVLTSVCRQVARWCADPTLVVPEVAINTSVRQLAEPGFVEGVAGVLQRSGMRPGQIALDVKETALFDGGAAPMSALHDLRDLGVRVVLDDFGTGWSSLSDLKGFPIAGLKIGGALIAGLAEGEEERHIVRAVTGLADALGLFVVAEGVETNAVAHAAAELGCGLAQGPLFADPVAAPAIEAMLRADPEELAAAGSTMALSDAAEVVGVSPSTLRRWADNGRLRVVRTAGGHRRFATEDVSRLCRETTGRIGPVLRPSRLPVGPIPSLAALLTTQDGREVVHHAAALLYEPGRSGWFALEAGSGHLKAWVGVLQGAAAGATAWDLALDATRDLAMRARRGGAAQVEGHLLLERIGPLMQFRLRERHASHAALVDTRRLLRALHRAMVDTEPPAER